MPDQQTEELLQLNTRLLESIDQADWATYQDLCDPSLSAIEPEAPGQVVEGMAFVGQPLLRRRLPGLRLLGAQLLLLVAWLLPSPQFLCQRPNNRLPIVLSAPDWAGVCRHERCR